MEIVSKLIEVRLISLGILMLVLYFLRYEAWPKLVLHLEESRKADRDNRDKVLSMIESQLVFYQTEINKRDERLERRDENFERMLSKRDNAIERLTAEQTLVHEHLEGLANVIRAIPKG